MNFETTLRRGDKGHLVRWLQQQLAWYARAGHLIGIDDVEVDGDFRGETEQAVRAFQSVWSLPVTGVFGPDEWAVLTRRDDRRDREGSAPDVPDVPFVLVEGPAIHDGRVFVKVRNATDATVNRGTPALALAVVRHIGDNVEAVLDDELGEVSAEIGPGEEYQHEWPLPPLPDGRYSIDLRVAGGYPVSVDFTVEAGAVVRDDFDYPRRDDEDEPRLHRGARGRWVAYLQELLIQAGRDAPVTGRFDASTEQAVKDYQRARGLRVDGVVGPQTWGALRDRLVGNSFVVADPYDDVVVIFDDKPYVDALGILNVPLRNDGTRPIAAGSRLGTIRLAEASGATVGEELAIVTEDSIPVKGRIDWHPPFGLPGSHTWSEGRYLLDIDLVSGLDLAADAEVRDEQLILNI